MKANQIWIVKKKKYNAPCATNTVYVQLDKLHSSAWTSIAATRASDLCQLTSRRCLLPSQTLPRRAWPRRRRGRRRATSGGSWPSLRRGRWAPGGEIQASLPTHHIWPISPARWRWSPWPSWCWWPATPGTAAWPSPSTSLLRRTSHQQQCLESVDKWIPIEAAVHTFVS